MGVAFLDEFDFLKQFKTLGLDVDVLQLIHQILDSHLEVLVFPGSFRGLLLEFHFQQTGGGSQGMPALTLKHLWRFGRFGSLLIFGGRLTGFVLFLGFFLFFLKAFPLLLVHRPGLFETVPVFTQFLVLLEKLVEQRSNLGKRIGAFFTDLDRKLPHPVHLLFEFFGLFLDLLPLLVGKRSFPIFDNRVGEHLQPGQVDVNAVEIHHGSTTDMGTGLLLQNPPRLG